jgi:hypothetical protein
MIDEADATDWFVDRQEHVARFQKDILWGGRRPFVLYGDNGRGKTALLQRLAEVAQKAGIVSASVSCSVQTPVDAVDLMALLARRLRLDLFKPFWDLIGRLGDADISISLTNPAGRQYSIANDSNFSGARTGDIVATKLVMESPTFRVELSQPLWRQRSRELTHIFIDCLQAAAAQRPVAIFFDHIDEAYEAIAAWIWEELVDPLRDGHLGGVTLVLVVGERHPTLDARTTKIALVRAHVARLAHEHMIDYVIGRIKTMDRQSASAFVLGATATDDGSMRALAIAVDAVIQRRERATAAV